MRVLIVEDTEDIAKAISIRLENAGHAVDLEANGADAIDLLNVQTYDLVILDLTLPGCDGLDVLRNIRSRRVKTPVLVLTARSEVNEKISALDLGADDYLTKPFDYGELEARARALMRRNDGLPDNSISFGPLVLDRKARVAAVDGEPLSLTRRELTVLEILASRPERIFSKEELVDQLFNFDQDPSSNAVEQFVARVRRKLSGSSVEIRTLRGLGYQIVHK
ncbi:Transcriptional regulatory protein QseB [Ensifer adhaerens]|nr:Transcriptional regulatory protein QseB [Ensifer adhaerens]